MIAHVPSRQHDEFAADMSRLLDPVRFCDVGFAVPEVESAMTLVACTFSTSSELAGQSNQRTYRLSKDVLRHCQSDGKLRCDCASNA